MTKRKEYTFNVTYSPREMTKHDEIMVREAINLYVEHLLKVAKELELDKKLDK